MQRAIDESERRRDVQLTYNKDHGITPVGVKKSVSDVMEGAYAGDAANDARARRKVRAVADKPASYSAGTLIARDAKSLAIEIAGLESKMLQLARNLEFEEAALLRDQAAGLKRQLLQAD
jgi:excinuclease ABC subunit B